MDDKRLKYRITESELSNEFKRDGETLYGGDLNRIVTITKGGINYNAELFESYLYGDEYRPFYHGNEVDWQTKEEYIDYGIVYWVRSVLDVLTGLPYVYVTKMEYNGTSESWVEKEIIKFIDTEQLNEVLEDYYNKDEVGGLLGAKVNTSDIVNNLTSTDVNKPLSANQGKVLNDTTAKLASSNVFTQPQQVPNATLPQHTTNLSQVETMFEMFKRELRGYNLLTPDLTDKEYLGDGWYNIFNLNNDNMDYQLDYNIYSGVFRENGEVYNLSIQTRWFDIITINNDVDNYVFTYIPVDVSGRLTENYVFAIHGGAYGGWTLQNANYNNTYSSVITPTRDSSNFFRYTFQEGTYNNVMWRLQIEKGTEATPYTVPGQIPAYETVGSENDDIKYYFDVSFSNYQSIRIKENINSSFTITSGTTNIYLREKFNSSDYRVIREFTFNHTLEHNDVLYWDLITNTIEKKQISTMTFSQVIVLAFVADGAIQYGVLQRFLPVSKESLYGALSNINYNTFKSYESVWEIGGLSGSGIAYYTPTRIRSKNYYNFEKPIKIDFDNSGGWRYGVQLFDENNNFVYDFGWRTSGFYLYPFGDVKKLRFTISKTDNSDITNLEESTRIKFNDTINKNIYINDESFVRGIAHRGLSMFAPENTMASLRLASYSGFRYVECDVQLTSDNKWVVIHDSTIDRTSNGTGSVSGMTLNQLKEYDYGSWKSPMYENETIPSLEEYIVEAKKYRINLYIELKVDPNIDRINELLDILYAHGVVEKTTIIAFNRLTLKSIVNIDPKINVGWIVNSLISSNVDNAVLDLKKQSNKVILHLYSSPIINKSEVIYARKNGVDVETSVLDDVSEISYAVENGVNGISTNYINIQEVLNG